MKTLVSMRAVSKWFGAREVLRDVDLTIADGERVVVIGENGCGKSTLLSLVAQVIDEDEGVLQVLHPIGFAPEKPDLPEHLLVAEWLDLVASLKRVECEHVLDVGALLHQRVSALSLGQRQRVALAGALMGSPPLLVLDEPTNALDRDVRERLIERLATTTALIATHDRDLADRIATRVVRLEDGRIAQDPKPL
jgi:ABC-type multidrug transport system ATPase subunit